MCLPSTLKKKKELLFQDEAMKPYSFFFFFFNFLFGIGTEPMNDVIVSGGQRRDLATHTHVSLLSQTYFHPGCNATLSRVLCTIQ